MKIKGFKAKNFRNIKNAEIEFSDGINLLIGKNAQGKTNVAEGIYLFSRGKSFRGATDNELISFDESGFYISVDYLGKSGDYKLEYSVQGKEKSRKKNGYRVSSITELIDDFKCVLFVPDDLNIVKGSPELRREFLNIASAKYTADYIKFYKGYKIATENRNCILKNAKNGLYYDMGELIAWGNSVAGYASHICEIRREYVEKIEKHAKKILYEISSGKEELSMRYKSDIDESISGVKNIEEEYKRIFSSDIDREIGAGFSLFGPCRDDIEIMINGKDARSFSSQGQKRSVILAIKLAEGEVIKKKFGEYPVFIFDDVMSELDEWRRKYIIENIKEKQIIITSCEKENYENIADRVIEVEGGSYVSSHR